MAAAISEPAECPAQLGLEPVFKLILLKHRPLADYPLLHIGEANFNERALTFFRHPPNFTNSAYAG